MVSFDDAPLVFGRLVADRLGPDAAREGRLLRDIYGRLSFVTARQHQAAWDSLQTDAAKALGAFSAPEPQIVSSLAKDEVSWSELAEETSIAVRIDDELELKLIDRRLAGEDWLMRPAKLVTDPRRLVFYSVKGGVGRSTALAVTAADFAARGFNVLVLDLDLEAPGLGTLLLPDESMPKFGVLDWFAAAAAGADAESLLADIAGPSPFTSARAIVDVVPAAGREPGYYLSKLARAYLPGSAGQRYAGFGFAKKAGDLMTQLASRQRYDLVLIDARAGLHETSGGLLLGLGARVLIFGTDTSQTFEDYRLLFGAFRDALDPISSSEDLRHAFKMVHAKAPRDEKERRTFRERSWNIWSDYLYDDVDPEKELSGDSYVFDLNDESAPHYPLEVIGDDSYARFDPRTETYPLSTSAYEPVFGNLLAGIRTMTGLLR